MTKKRLVEINDELWKKVKVYAAIHNITIGKTPEHILKEYFKNKEGIDNAIKEEGY